MSFQPQPSAQGIASLYQGNPGALQQKIQKDQQAKPGMPQDLSKLMALNIVTNENDAAKRQEAMNQLQQLMGQQTPMGGAPGQPPTVAQSIEAQAKQKMETMAAEQAKQQQAMHGIAQQAGQAPGPVPEGIPQPQEQPQAQGIDQLPAEFKMAGGGIVAFANEGATLDEATRAVMKELGVSARDFIDNPETAKTVRSLAAEHNVAAPVAEAAAPAATGAAQNVGRWGDAAAAAGKQYGPAIRQAAGAVKSAVGPVLTGALGAAPAAMNMAEQSGFYNDADVPTGEKAKQALRETAHTLVPWLTGTVGAGMGSVAAPIAGTLAGGAAGYGLGKGLTSLAVDEEGEALKAWRAAHPEAKTAAPAAVTPQVVTQNNPTSQRPGDAITPRYPQAAAPAAVTPEVNALEQRLKQLQGTGNVNVPSAPRPAVAGAPGSPAIGGIPMAPALAKMRDEDADLRKREAMKEMEGLAPNSKYADMAMAEYDRRAKQLERPKQGYDAFMELMGQIGSAPRGVGSLTAGNYGVQKVKEMQKQSEADIFDLTMKKLDLGFKNEEAQRSFKLETLKTGRDVYDKVKDNTFKALQEQGHNDRQASANATSTANAAMQASVAAQGHKLQAEMQLRQLINAEKRGDRDNAALQLRALSETAKDMGTLLKVPGYIQTPEGKAMLDDYKSYLAAIGKMGGVTSVGPSLSSAPPPTGGKAVGKV